MLIAVIRAEQSCDILYVSSPESVTAACSLCLLACSNPFICLMRRVECKQRVLWETGTQKQSERVKEKKSKTGHLTNSLETDMKEWHRKGM